MEPSPPELKPDGVVAFEPVGLGRRQRRLDPGSLAVVLAVVLVGAAIIRPWGDGNHQPAALTGPLPTGLRPSPAPTDSPSPSPSAIPLIALARSAAERVIRSPGGNAESWGLAVGAGTSPAGGPSFEVGTEVPIISIALDGSWSAWAPVQPRPSSMPAPGASTELTGVTAARLCAGLPDLPSGAQVVALTAPGLPRDYLQVRGWQVVGWHDEPRAIELLPSTHNLTTHNAGAIDYLEQPDGAPWPDGRYEILVGGSTDASLTVCLGRP